VKRFSILVALFMVAACVTTYVQPPVPGAVPMAAPTGAQADYDSTVACVSLSGVWGAPRFTLSQIRWRVADTIVQNGSADAAVSNMDSAIITIAKIDTSTHAVIQHELAHTLYHIPRLPTDSMHPYDPFYRCKWAGVFTTICDATGCHLQP
jgi:hypothetical protein